jgi:dimethylglycine catabolism A
MLVQGMALKMPELLTHVEGDTPRELTVKEIEQMIDVMVEQVVHAYRLGFDAVELHSPHGYLLHAFLSPRSNKRRDQYGGSIENRGRVVTSIIERVRAKIGPDKPLGARLSGDELMPGGMTHEEACQFVKLFTDAGANFFDVSQGSYENPGAAFAPDEEGGFSKWVPGFKKASGGKPIICPGWMLPQTASDAVKNGVTDIASLGRPSICDPFWPAKAKAGREKDIVKCARCQTCYLTLNTATWCNCPMNPTAGYEEYYPELWKTGGFSKRAKKWMAKCEGLDEI